MGDKVIKTKRDCNTLRRDKHHVRVYAYSPMYEYDEINYTW